MEDLLLDLEMNLSTYFETAPYLVSLLAGMITFLTPCVLPMIPPYLSYITGLSIAQLQGQEKLGLAQRLKIIQASLMFVLGFSLVFVVIGVLSDTFIGQLMTSSWFKLGGGLLIIFFGLHFMHILTIRFLNFQKQSNFGNCACFFAPFLLGLSFALGWSPCMGPILGSIVMLSGNESGGGQAVWLMSTYALGLGLPFIFAAVLTEAALGFFNKVKRYFKWIEIIAGTMLIMIGGAISYEGLNELLQR